MLPFNINFEFIILNCYYLGVAIAFIVRDILWLRVVMILAGGSVITYGVLTNNKIVIYWNCLFITINIFQVIRLIIERKPEKIDKAIIDIYENVFSEMTRNEFNYFWKNGIVKKTKGHICKSGDIQEKLFLLIKGVAMVKRSENVIAHLVRGSFIAEMAYITQKPATADVLSEEEVHYITWTRSAIDRMNTFYPNIKNKLQLILSKDLIQKLMVYDKVD